jgi:hypothetical protein
MTRETRFATCVAVAVFLALSVSPAHAAPRTKLVVMVTDDDSPALAARIVIRPTGVAAEWPRGKDQIELVTDERGRAWTRLGVGQYLVTANQSLGSKEPALTLVTIPAESSKPIQVRLVLQYWDCAKVQCQQ